MAAVVLPLPGPVFTMINPRRMSCILGIIDCTFFGRAVVVLGRARRLRLWQIYFACLNLTVRCLLFR
jgi:hypothetical protein